MSLQSTIQKEVKLKGAGIHTGKAVNVTLKPASIDSGIRFVRVDLPDRPTIKCDIENVIDIAKRPRRTSIGDAGAEVHTVEHLLASLAALGIDNITVELDSEELPGFDGSALSFVEALKKAGRQEQDKQKSVFDIKEPVWVEENGATLLVIPSKQLTFSYTLNYDHPFLQSQFLTYNIDADSFEKELAPSRTFCTESEANELQSQGLGKGANYDNTVVVGEKGVIKNKLRFKDEFVRHKIIDLIGDLNLLGFPIKAHVIGFKSGHAVNIQLLRKIKNLKIRQEEGRIPAVHVEPFTDILDVSAIERILPHRYPFLFVDRIIELEENKRAVGIKNVTMNDYFFKGHFPGRPVMPGVIIIEALAQVAGVLMLNKRDNLGKHAYFISIEKAKFRKVVVPGDQLRLEVEVARLKTKIAQIKGRALVDGKVAAEADLMFTIVDPS